MACSFSSVITCISSALDDVNFSESSYCYSVFLNVGILKKQRYWLRNLKTFVLFARKLGDKNKNGSLGSLLIKIEDSVGTTRLPTTYTANRYSQEIRGLKGGGFQSLKEEIDEWYIAMLDNKRQSNSLTADEVAEITESIWDTLVDFCSLRELIADKMGDCNFSGEVFADAMEVLREHMHFLKNFCPFATRRGV